MGDVNRTGEWGEHAPTNPHWIQTLSEKGQDTPQIIAQILPGSSTLPKHT